MESRLQKRIHPSWVGTYGFLAPATLLLLGVFGVPLIQSVVLSLQKSAGMAGTSGWAGAQNYIDSFKDPQFWSLLLQTIIWTVGVIVPTTVIAFVLALLLQMRIPGKAILRVGIMFPWAISLSLSAVVWKFAVRPEGLVDTTFTMFGLKKFIQPWLADTPQAFLVLIAVGIWVSVPFTTVMLAAAMKGIPQEIYEAASMESAKAWHRAWFFTLPLTRRVLAIVTMGNFVIVFNSFPIIFIMTGGGPVYKTSIMATYIYSKAFSELDFAHSSALSVIVAVLLFAFSLLYVRLVVNRAKQ